MISVRGTTLNFVIESLWTLSTLILNFLMEKHLIVFQNSALVDFMSLKHPYFPELVKVFYYNLKIQDGVLYFEVHKFPLLLINLCFIH